MILDAPNRPPNNGRRGSFTGEFRDAKPRMPVARNTTSAVQTLFSLIIVYNDMKIRIKGIV